MISKLRKLNRILLNTILPYRSRRVRYYNQMSARWYFCRYGQERLGDVGCGPVVCAITASTLLNKRITPVQAAHWAQERGYYERWHGSLHSLIPDWSREMGLRCEDLGDDLTLLRERLRTGDSLGILLCRQGTFSGGRHFVTVGLENQGFKVYNSADVRTCYKVYREEQLRDALAKERIWIGPVWWVTKR